MCALGGEGGVSEDVDGMMVIGCVGVVGGRGGVDGMGGGRCDGAVDEEGGRVREDVRDGGGTEDVDGMIWGGCDGAVDGGVG